MSSSYPAVRGFVRFVLVLHTIALSLESVDVLKPVNDGCANLLMRRVGHAWESTGHSEWKMFVVHLNAISFERSVKGWDDPAVVLVCYIVDRKLLDHTLTRLVCHRRYNAFPFC